MAKAKSKTTTTRSRKTTSTRTRKATTTRGSRRVNCEGSGRRAKGGVYASDRSDALRGQCPVCGRSIGTLADEVTLRSHRSAETPRVRAA